MANYNLTTLWAGNNIYDYYAALNDITGQKLSMLLLAVIFIVIYFSTSSMVFSRKLFISSLATTLVCTGLFFLGLLGQTLLIIMILISVSTLLYDAFS